MSLRTISGKQLYALLPQHYRNRDETGDLAAFMDGCGELLDLIRNTLEQRMADAYPDTAEVGPSCQDWVLPYLAATLGVQPLGATAAARRAEVTSAVRWAQRKGTRITAEEMVEAITGREAVVSEGWQLLAMTPVIGEVFNNRPLPSKAAQASALLQPTTESMTALPNVTPDFRKHSRPVICERTEPGANISNFNGVDLFWCQRHPSGVPCFPGSYADVSKRTVDLRDPTLDHGRIHPRRILFYLPPASGFFSAEHELTTFPEPPPEQDTEILTVAWDAQNNIYQIAAANHQQAPVFDNETVHFNQALLDVSHLHFSGTLHFSGEQLRLTGCAIKHLIIEAAPDDTTVNALEAEDCLFEEITVVQGAVKLTYCTVLSAAKLKKLLASDCIFAGSLEIAEHEHAASCIRYSRIPPLFSFEPEHITEPKIATNTIEPPSFLPFASCTHPNLKAGLFHQPGRGVLHPDCPESIRFGAEDGGEMGAFHHRAYSLSEAAILEKLADALPIGNKPVLIPDPMLYFSPPTLVKD